MNDTKDSIGNKNGHAGASWNPDMIYTNMATQLNPKMIPWP